MVRAEDETHHMRHDQAYVANGALTETARPVKNDAAMYTRGGREDIHAEMHASFSPAREQIQNQKAVV